MIDHELDYIAPIMIGETKYYGWQCKCGDKDFEDSPREAATAWYNHRNYPLAREALALWQASDPASYPEGSTAVRLSRFASVGASSEHWARLTEFAVAHGFSLTKAVPFVDDALDDSEEGEPSKEYVSE